VKPKDAALVRNSESEQLGIPVRDQNGGLFRNALREVRPVDVIVRLTLAAVVANEYFVVEFRKGKRELDEGRFGAANGSFANPRWQELSPIEH
jgi:hypothetical protein